MTTARPDSRIGTDLGPYRIERVLGRGGMGVVYLAEQRELGRKVALKLLPDELASDADFRARFERESRLAASLDHPNIIPIFEAGEVDGTVFLAMRHVDGTDLASRMRADPPPPPEAILHVLAQVARALDVAHARGLVHRDVKPANVLLDPSAGDAEGDHAYLTDFGLTKQAGSESGLTKAGSFLGTLAYMAPEQIEGQDVDGRADQYSLAAVAFEALTGQVPFKRDQEIAVAMAHVKDPVPSAVSLRPELPAAVDVVVARGLAKDRAAHYPGCVAFVDDLRTACAGGAVAARPVRHDRRGRALVVAAVGLGLVAVAGLALASGLGGAGTGAAPPSGSIRVASPSGPTLDASAFPNSAEAELLAKIPPDWRNRCVRRDDAVIVGSAGDVASPLAGARCTIGNVAFDVSQLTGDGVTAQDALRQVAAEHAVPAGDCELTTPATGRWSQGAREVGSVICYLDGVSAVVEWTYDDEQILVGTNVPFGDVKSVVSWWLDTRDLIGSSQQGVEAPFPSTAEAALISRVPVALGPDDCRRGSYSRIAVSVPIRPIASIRCPQPGAVTFLEIRQFSDVEEVVASDLLAALNVAPGGCPPPARADGRWAIGDRDIGALACWRDNIPNIVIDWSYDDARILARATRAGTDRLAAFEWWLVNAPLLSP